jgi:hypothetical protein
MRTGKLIASALLLFTAAVLPAPIFAANYALLIGVGKYPFCEKIPQGDHYGIDLDGPRYDVAALKAILTSHFQYSEDHITVLLDERATRQAILDGIGNLVKTVKPGDHVLIYYSGHGTSSYSDGGFGMDPATGGIVPSDIRLDQPSPKILAQLVVGKRDLRPLLSELDKKATVLVIFDACFSGESVKSLEAPSPTRARFIDPLMLVPDHSQMPVPERAVRSLDDYPYKHVVYLSAAANNETAGDMPVRLVAALKGKYPVYQGEPHGVFTNALLVKMQEPNAGKNCVALMRDIRGMLVSYNTITGTSHPQHPQHLFAPAETDTDQVCIEHAASAAPAPSPSPNPTPATSNKIRQALDQLAAEATSKLNCSADKSSYSAGEKTVITCDLPQDGHVSVMSYGMGDERATVLLPNRYDDGSVKAGQIRIPALQNNTGKHWSIANALPKGADQQEQVMLVLFSADELDTKSLAPAGTFSDLPRKDVPSVRSQYISAGYNAVEITFPITPGTQK